MRFIRGACVALALVAAACGSSKSNPASPGTEAVNQTFTGTLSDGSLVTLDFGTPPAALTALQVRRAATQSGVIQVTGTITRLDGSTVALTGTYDPATKQFTISGGAYQFTGTYDGGAIQAQATVNGTPVVLVAMIGPASTTTRYCGTFTTAAHETGTFNIVVSGTKAFGVADDSGSAVTFSGTVNGTTIAMRDARNTPINATIKGTGVTGTFTNSDGLGSFSGSVERCAEILNPPPPACTSFEYSAWNDCQSDGTQTRTVTASLPAGCSGGAATVVSQSCTYVPPEPGACTYTYSDWSACTPDKTQTRTVIGATPEGCTGTPVLEQACTYTAPTCTSFEYSPWGECQPDGTQTRKVNSALPAGCTGGSPILTQLCAPALSCDAPASDSAAPSKDKYTTTAGPPPAQGGTIPNGTYDLWQSTYYGQSADSTSASSDRRTLIIANSDIEVIAAHDTTVDGRFLGTLTVDGQAKTLTITITCSSNPGQFPLGSVMGPIPYTVDTTNLPGSTLLKLNTQTRSQPVYPKEEAYILQ